jgi:Two component regulator propeller
VQLCQRETRQPTLRAWRLVSAFVFLLIIWSTSFSGATTSPNASSEMHRGDPRSVRVPVIDGDDIRFSRLSTAQGLSQTQANQIVQDDQGFIWFGTQYGLDRYNGYEFKVFTHDPARENSLSCVYIHSLFKDRSGSLWVGCDQFLDRFDSLHETFTHYRIDAGEVANYVSQISQDRTGMLWLATGSGLFRLNPDTGLARLCAGARCRRCGVTARPDGQLPRRVREKAGRRHRSQHRNDLVCALWNCSMGCSSSRSQHLRQAAKVSS